MLDITRSKWSKQRNSTYRQFSNNKNIFFWSMFPEFKLKIKKKVSMLTEKNLIYLTIKSILKLIILNVTTIFTRIHKLKKQNGRQRNWPLNSNWTNGFYDAIFPATQLSRYRRNGCIKGFRCTHCRHHVQGAETTYTSCRLFQTWEIHDVCMYVCMYVWHIPLATPPPPPTIILVQLVQKIIIIISTKCYTHYKL
jgi:hypothetical protein